MTPTSSAASSAANTYPASADPLLQAAWAHFGLDLQVASLLRTLSDRVDGLRLKLLARNSLIDAFGQAVARSPAADRVDFLQVDAAERERLQAELAAMGLSGQVTAVAVTGSSTLFTFRVVSADMAAVGEGLSQGIQALMTQSQTQQLELQNHAARYSTLGQTVASLQKSYVALASSLNRSMAG